MTHQGRADDAIKVKGKWLSPQEVESCLLEHPAVKECAVIATEDDDGLLKPTEFVVASTTTSKRSCTARPRSARTVQAPRRVGSA